MSLAVCGVQMAPRLGRPRENLQTVLRELRAAADEGAALVVFPEAALTGYVYADAAAARAGSVSADGRELATLAEACREAAMHVVVGAIERDGPELYNSAFLLGPDGPVGRYRKVHTLCLGVDRFVRRGEGPLVAHQLPFGRVGLAICYDASFPETARLLRLAGARLILLPTNWPRLSLKRALVQIRALENHAFFFAVNRTGTEAGVRFHGGSIAAGPDGEVLAHGGSGPERLHLTLDMARAERSRVVVSEGEYEYDYVADRRPELYGPLTESVRGEPTVPVSGGAPVGAPGGPTPD